MSIALLFWILMILWLVFSLWRDYEGGAKAIGGHVFQFVLFALLGWKVFGAAVHN